MTLPSASKAVRRKRLNSKAYVVLGLRTSALIRDRFGAGYVLSDLNHEAFLEMAADDPVLEGEMPLRSYLLAHPEARLTDAERAALAHGLGATAELSPVTGAADDHAADEAHEEGE